MNNFEIKLKKLTREYLNKNIDNIELAVQNILTATIKEFLYLYSDTMEISKRDMESKIYHINDFFNICKREVINNIKNEEEQI